MGKQVTAGTAASFATLVETSVCAVETDVPSGAAWVDMGGATAKLDFLAPVSKMLGQINFVAQATGTGAEVRVVERLGADLSDEVVIAGPLALPDSAGNWSVQVMNTAAVPREGRNEYVLQGRLNGATSAQIRSAVLIVLENQG